MNFDEDDHFHLINEEAAQILMHRDIHFGGEFAVMLEYYKKKGRGAHPDIEVEAIEELAAQERQHEDNIAAVALSGAQAERIHQALAAYTELRSVYETEAEGSRMRRIADLILTDSDHPEEEISAVVDLGEDMIPPLLEILHSETLHDPLFPGYGLAPLLAAECLGRIGHKRAINSLFEQIRNEQIFHEDIYIRALAQIGKPAKEFLLKTLTSLPITSDNERAAIALSAFSDDPELSKSFLALLLKEEVWKDPVFTSYLINGCAHLPDEMRAQFLSLRENSDFPEPLKDDIKLIASYWNTV